MSNLAKALSAMLACVLLTGLGAAVCGSCTYNAQSTITEGTIITLQGPADSGSQHRPVTWQWILYDCDDSGKIANFNLVSPSTTTAQTISFYAPQAGNYRVGLTVRDQIFDNTCVDIRDFCFTTTAGDCPILCCAEVCEDDTPDYTKCPWHMAYNPSIIVPTWQYKWLINGVVVETDLSPGPIAINIDWSNGYTPGDYALSFEIWAPNPVTGTLERIRNCVNSCTCGAGSPTLTPCTVRVVQKPTATISGP